MNTSRILQSSALVLAVVAASISGCSDDSATGGSPATGGTAGKSTGGGSSGGASATGGKASTGGSSSGGAATGGSKATGGTSSGGAAAGGTSSGGMSSSATGGAVSGSGGAVGASMIIGTGACSLPDAAVSAMGKTCVDYCGDWLGPAKSCHDMDGYTNVYTDTIDGSDCQQKCSMFSEAQFCCRMEHVALSLVELAKISQAQIDDPNLKNFPGVVLHCGHASGQTLCQ